MRTTYCEAAAIDRVQFYQDPSLENERRSMMVWEAAANLRSALEYRYPKGYDADEVKLAWNLDADDGEEVVTRAEFLKMRDYAVAGWKVLLEIQAAWKTRDQNERLDKIHDILKYADYDGAEFYMPDIIKNSEK